MNSYLKGKNAESKAAQFLQNLGYKIIEKNFFCKGGEIDIVAFKNNTIHFVEVKSGKNFQPVYNITPQKLKRIIKCAHFYLKKHSIKSAYCISAVIIKKDEIEFLKNITI